MDITGNNRVDSFEPLGAFCLSDMLTISGQFDLKFALRRVGPLWLVIGYLTKGPSILEKL